MICSSHPLFTTHSHSPQCSESPLRRHRTPIRRQIRATFSKFRSCSGRSGTPAQIRQRFAGATPLHLGVLCLSLGKWGLPRAAGGKDCCGVGTCHCGLCLCLCAGRSLGLVYAVKNLSGQSGDECFFSWARPYLSVKKTPESENCDIYQVSLSIVTTKCFDRDFYM